jgi:hypothetical protein
MSDQEINKRYQDSQWAIEPEPSDLNDDMTDEEWWTS